MLRVQDPLRLLISCSSLLGHDLSLAPSESSAQVPSFGSSSDPRNKHDGRDVPASCPSDAPLQRGTLRKKAPRKAHAFGFQGLRANCCCLGGRENTNRWTHLDRRVLRLIPQKHAHGNGSPMAHESCNKTPSSRRHEVRQTHVLCGCGQRH